MELLFKEERKNNKINKIEMIQDNKIITTIIFDHDKSEMITIVNEDLTIKELEEIYAYGTNFNNIEKAIFMEIGYEFFKKLQEEDPERAEELKEHFTQQ